MEWRGTGRQVNPGTDYTNNLSGGHTDNKDCTRLNKDTGLWEMIRCAYPTMLLYSICEADPM